MKLKKETLKALKTVLDKGPMTDKRSVNSYEKAMLKLQGVLSHEHVVKLVIARDQNNLNEWNRIKSKILEQLGLKGSDLADL